MKKTVPGIALAAILAAAIFALRRQGRLWICSCGHILLWSGNPQSSDNSQHLFDPYSLTHVLHGFLIFGLVALLMPRLPAAWQFVTAIAIEAAWEVFENTNFVIQRYRTGTISLGYAGDSIVNSLGDIAACGLGVLVARRLGVLKTTVVFVVIEVGLLLSIRDSLLLNILMLIHPVEAVKVWQLR